MTSHWKLIIMSKDGTIGRLAISSLTYIFTALIFYSEQNIPQNEQSYNCTGLTHLFKSKSIMSNRKVRSVD